MRYILKSCQMWVLIVLWCIFFIWISETWLDLINPDFTMNNILYEIWIFFCSISQSSRILKFYFELCCACEAANTFYVLVQHGKRWYEFNDRLVEQVREENIRTAAAYVLFYRRISDT